MPGKANSARRSTEETAVGHAPQAASLLCEKTFADFRMSQPPGEVGEAVQLYLVETDMRLLRIAGARARRDCAAVAREAHTLARIAQTLGLLQASGLARQLEEACLSGDRAVTYGLIGRLSEVFQLSGAALDALLRRGTGAGC